MAQNRAKFITVLTLDSSTINTMTYTAIGAISNAAAVVNFTNASNKDITLSVDGTNAAFVVPANTNKTFQFMTNSQLPSKEGMLAANTMLSAKGTAGVGNLYIDGFYF